MTETVANRMEFFLKNGKMICRDKKKMKKPVKKSEEFIAPLAGDVNQIDEKVEVLKVSQTL